MNVPEQMEIVRQWVAKAENDLKNADHTLTMGDDCPLDTVCFHAQQCAEKYLKALLPYQQIDFPKSHDLAEFAALLTGMHGFPLSVDECERLTDYATVTHYPGNWEAIDRHDAEKAVAMAKRVRTVIRGLLQEETTKGGLVL